MKNAIVITIFLLLLFYITGVFCNADLNIVNWDSELRKGLGIGFIFVELMFLAFYGMILDNKNK